MVARGNAALFLPCALSPYLPPITHPSPVWLLYPAIHYTAVISLSLFAHSYSVHPPLCRLTVSLMRSPGGPLPDIYPALLSSCSARLLHRGGKMLLRERGQ